MKKTKKKISSREKSTFQKFIWTSGERYKFFVWDKNIHNTFLVLLVITVIILAFLTYTQNLLIKELKKGYYVDKYNNYQNIDSELIVLEDFIIENNIASSTLADLATYFKENGYEVEIGAGYLQASIKNYDDEDKCTETVYRFNQRKGMYLDKFIVESYDKKR